jgi:hypothetical protein
MDIKGKVAIVTGALAAKGEAHSVEFLADSPAFHDYALKR